jgi:lysozyme
MNRKPIFEAAKRCGADFNKPGNVAIMDAGIDESLREALATVPAPRPSQGLGRRSSPECTALMHDFENCPLEAYPDPGSKDGHPWTIGWGSTGPDIVKGTRWTQAEADARFARDSSLLRYHKAGNYAAAAKAFASWKFNDGREMKGLVRRRAAEAKLYEGKPWR